MDSWHVRSTHLGSGDAVISRTRFSDRRRSSRMQLRRVPPQAGMVSRHRRSEYESSFSNGTSHASFSSMLITSFRVGLFEKWVSEGPMPDSILQA